jgi:hypothetical protein
MSPHAHVAVHVHVHVVCVMADLASMRERARTFYTEHSKEDTTH